MKILFKHLNLVLVGVLMFSIFGFTPTKATDISSPVSIQGGGYSEINFNIKNSKIYHDGQLHIQASNGDAGSDMYLKANHRIHIQSGDLYFMRNYDYWPNSQSRIYDDGQFHIATDDYLYLDGPTITYVLNKMVVGGDTTFMGNVGIAGGLSFSGDFNLNGHNIINVNEADINDLNVATSINTVALTATGMSSLNDLYVNGTSTMIGALDLRAGVANSSGDVTVNDNLLVTGGANINGNIWNSTSSVNINDNLVVTGTSDLRGVISNTTGDIVLGDNIAVTGMSDLQNSIWNSVGNVTVSDYLTVDNLAYLNGGINVNSGAFTVDTVGNLTVSGTSNFKDAIYNSIGALTINDHANVLGDLRVRNIYPEADASYDIGNSTDQFRALYLDATGGAYVGDVATGYIALNNSGLYSYGDYTTYIGSQNHDVQIAPNQNILLYPGSGDIFTYNLVPDSDDVYNIGNSSGRYVNQYLSNASYVGNTSGSYTRYGSSGPSAYGTNLFLYSDGSVTANPAGAVYLNPISGNSYSYNFMPNDNLTWDLGSSVYNWLNGYFENVIAYGGYGSGGTTINNTIHTEGNIYTDSGLYVNADDFTVDSSGNTYIAGTLEVDGQADFDGNVDANNGIDVTSGNLNVDLGDFNINGGYLGGGATIYHNGDIATNERGYFDGMIFVGDYMGNNINIYPNTIYSTGADLTLDGTNDIYLNGNNLFLYPDSALTHSYSIVPDGTGYYNGDASHVWDYGYFSDLYATTDLNVGAGNFTVNSDGDTYIAGTLEVDNDSYFNDNIHTTNILPNADDTWNIGSDPLRYVEVYLSNNGGVYVGDNKTDYMSYDNNGVMSHGSYDTFIDSQNGNTHIDAGNNTYIDAIGNTEIDAGGYVQVTSGATEDIYLYPGSGNVFTYNVAPNTDSTYDLGSGSRYWANSYIDSLYLNDYLEMNGGNLTINSDGDVYTAGTLEVDDISYLDGGAITNSVTASTGNLALTSSSGNVLVGGGNTVRIVSHGGDITINPSGALNIWSDTYSENIYPSADSTYDLGSSLSYWANSYVDSMYLSNYLEMNGGNLTVDSDGDTYTAGTLDVDGLSSLDGGIDVNGGNFTVATNGDVYALGTLDIDGIATVNNDLYTNNIYPNADSSYNIGAAGNEWYAGYFDGLEVAGGFDAGSGTGTSIGVDINTIGSLFVGGDAEIRGDIVNNDGDVTVNDDFVVTGNSDLNGSVSNSTGNLDLNDNTDITGTLSATGLASLDGGIDTDGVFTVTDVTGDVYTAGTLDVDGITTLNDDATAENIFAAADNTYDLGSAVNAWRNAYIYGIEAGNVNVGGGYGIGGITLDGLTGNGQFGGDMTVDGTSTLAGNVDAQNGLDITGANLSVGGALFSVNVLSGGVTSADTITGLTVSDGAGVSMTGGILTAVTLSDGTLTISAGDLSTTGDLDVGDTTVNTLVDEGTFDVRGDIYNGGGGNVVINDDAVVDGEFYVSGTISDPDSTSVTINDGLVVNGNINLGANTLQGTNAVINFNNFDVAAAGAITIAAGQGLDANAAGTLSMGSANATFVDVAGGYGSTGASFSASGNLQMNGNLTVDGTSTLTSATYADGGLDRSAAASLAIGGTNANAVTISKDATMTTVEGTLNVDEAVTLDNTLAVDDIDSLTATTLLIGKATATKVEIADTGIETEIQGSLDVLEAVTLNGQVTIGDGGDTVTINSSDWDISATGDMSGIGDITADGDVDFSGAISLKVPVLGAAPACAAAGDRGSIYYNTGDLNTYICVDDGIGGYVWDQLN